MKTNNPFGKTLSWVLSLALVLQGYPLYAGYKNSTGPVAQDAKRSKKQKPRRVLFTNSQGEQIWTSPAYKYLMNLSLESLSAQEKERAYKEFRMTTHGLPAWIVAKDLNSSASMLIYEDIRIGQSPAMTLLTDLRSMNLPTNQRDANSQAKVYVEKFIAEFAERTQGMPNSVILADLENALAFNFEGFRVNRRLLKKYKADFADGQPVNQEVIADLMKTISDDLKEMEISQTGLLFDACEFKSMLRSTLHIGIGVFAIAYLLGVGSGSLIIKVGIAAVGVGVANAFVTKHTCVR